MAADILGSTSSANSPYSQFFDSRALYSIATSRPTFQKTCIYTKPALHPNFIPSYLNTFQLCSLTCPEGTQFTHPSRTQGKPSVYHLRATRTPPHLPTSNNQPSTPIKESFQQPCSLTCPEGTRFTHPQVSGLPFQVSGLPFQVSCLKSQISPLNLTTFIPPSNKQQPTNNKQPTTPIQQRPSNNSHGLFIIVS